ncbi:uroporphyrinogen-III C-methyltransferase [Photobacterium japonica]|uniref:uroporphyrinogen-III C-methyltransferase n=1 Tax=Photobacterium japonica TaxID=2910235 RepID=UPI003D0E730D
MPPGKNPIQEQGVGQVALVGAGPGDPALLTVKATQCIALADVIVYDRLVSDAIRATFPSSARLLYVGKAKGCVSLSQGAINQRLVDLAQQGYRVCRLKGGDAFVFGRGSEELQALAAHDIPVEVVPGITAAAGCTSYAGIPLTHRGVSQGCTFVTAHAEKQTEKQIEKQRALNWTALAQLNHTLVFYMGLTKADDIATHLQAAGMPALTPVAVIENGCCPEQRVITGMLSALPALVARHHVISPALIVVGDVVALSQPLPVLWQQSQSRMAAVVQPVSLSA